MSYTNSTPNYALPQWIGTDKPTFLGDFNSAFSAIDTQMKVNADASTAATATANSAAATATSANTNATTALNTANSAASQAASATSAAASATSTANTASTDAAAALRASAANTIENLAPAYDPTLTYNVGDLVTFIDDQNSGKLYKCIVAVNSPMEFNINYWDDVTTSDVYKKIHQIRITFESTDTFNDVLDKVKSAIAGFSTEDLSNTTIKMYNNTGFESVSLDFKDSNKLYMSTARTIPQNFECTSYIISLVDNVHSISYINISSAGVISINAITMTDVSSFTSCLIEW